MQIGLHSFGGWSVFFLEKNYFFGNEEEKGKTIFPTTIFTFLNCGNRRDCLPPSHSQPPQLTFFKFLGLNRIAVCYVDVGPFCLGSTCDRKIVPGWGEKQKNRLAQTTKHKHVTEKFLFKFSYILRF
jgi:hypothetical protein